MEATSLKPAPQLGEGRGTVGRIDCSLGVMGVEPTKNGGNNGNMGSIFKIQ